MRVAVLAELERVAIYAQASRGLIPHSVFRPMLPHEIRSGINFVAIDRSLRDGYAAAADILATLRESMVASLAAAVGGSTDGKVIAARVAEWVENPPKSVLTAKVLAKHQLHEALIATAARAGDQLRAEARHQGVVSKPVVVKAAGGVVNPVELLDEAALPIAALSGAITQAATLSSQRPSSSDTPVAAADKASTAAALDSARQGVHIANGEGRSAAAAELPPPAAVYASELLDERTCDPCGSVDGTDYASISEAEDDYPGQGPYKDCEGGARCRGTLVIVWDETPPGSEPPPELPPEPPIPPIPSGPDLVGPMAEPVKPGGVPSLAQWDPTANVWKHDFFDMKSGDWIVKEYAPAGTLTPARVLPSQGTGVFPQPLNPPAGAYMWDSEIGIWVKPGMLFDDGKAAWMEKVGGTWKEVPGGQLVPPKPVVVEPVGPVGAVDTGRRALGREFFNEEEGNMWASVNWPNSSGYSAAEQRAMMSYTESGFRETNRALRNSGGLTGGVKAMDSAFLTAPALAEPIVVTRGATLAEFGLGQGENPMTLIGKTRVDHAYLSTSVARDPAFNRPAVVQFNLPVGQRAVYVSHWDKPLSAMGHSENELILDRGTTYVVRDVVLESYYGEDRWRLMVDVLPK